MTGPLIIGVGNPLRGDDGVGWAVVERSAADPRMEAVRTRTVQQLTPELADEVAAASLVVLVDADVGLLPGAVDVHQVGPGGQGPLGHHLGPGALVELVTRLFGVSPPVLVVAVGAQSFDGEGLSPSVAAAVAAAADRVVHLVLDRFEDQVLATGELEID